jgi:transcriptional regulator with PAS, ATPase and Fis domain
MKKKAEKEIFAQKKSLRSDKALSEDLRTYRDWEDILDNITDMITIHDRNYNIIHANKAAEKLLKLPLLKDKIAKCFEHYHGENAPPEGCPSCACISTGSPVAFERFEPYLNKFLEIRAMPQFNKKKQLIGVIHIARDITERKQMEEEITSLKKHLLTGQLDNEAAFSSVITRSKKMLAIFQYIEAVARSEKPVFITGETGVGKELIARSVHIASGLKGEHVAVDVAGLDDTMFSDTLFGHKKGAFTGADKDRKGLIVRASGGTLLLDEIGDLHTSSQVKLLRLLEEKIYYPLGSDIPEKSKARIIACSNQDIEKQLERRRFRRDLYYRLCAHHIHIPPLRERLQDVSLLLGHFLGEASRIMNKKKPAVSPELVTLLSNYHFPGNVRELQAMVHDAVAQHKSGWLSLNSFKGYIKQRRSLPKSAVIPADDTPPSFRDIFRHFPTLKEMESFLVSEAMKSSNDNQGSAASLLGITRQALNQRLKKKKQNS